ncbi:RnfABCDGE type electron transport complex subunit D [candidate division KSB1 bacterium]|nr:RnfABCDGE type electron transport complex subunit D [candidate division KSB1 bacterium]
MTAFTIEFQKQKVMRTVVYSLFPVIIGAIYFFGWISLAIVLISVITCVSTEWLFVRGKKGKVSEAVFVTAVLYGLTLPPTLPFYMVILGAIFGITFGKMAFGGFGNNVFNPALVGRGFVYITFPMHMTTMWLPAADFSQFPGGFVHWHFLPMDDSIATITSATPLSAFRDGATSLPGYLQLFLGNIFGQFEKLGELTRIGGGSIGETSALLIMIGGIYIIYKKAANWRLVVSFFSGFLIMQTALYLAVPEKAADPLFALLAGGVLFGGFYMITDPISAARTDIGRWIYGILAGMLTVLIRTFSLFAGGVMFAILLANMFGPIIDYAVNNVRQSKKPSQAN